MNLICLFLLLFFTSCATHQPIAESIAPAELEALIDEVKGDMVASQELRLSSLDDSGAIPPEIKSRVQKWLVFFTEKDRSRFQTFLNRGEYYRPMIQSQLSEIGVPTELYYLAMIESGFQVHAASHASAVGVWQFIKATGQRYGLVVNPFIDERRDPMRATVAAANYLRDLNVLFQSWFLAMAAYNAGESRIMQAIMKHKTRNFWELAAKGALPSETMNYVPKFIAASVIGHHPEKFGFSVDRGSRLPELTRVEVPARVDIQEVAQKLQIDPTELKNHNPHVRQSIIGVDRNTYQLWVPKSYEEHIENRQDALAQLEVHDIDLVDTRVNAPRKRKTIHVVKRGESVATIAREYQLKPKHLREWNHLDSGRLKPGKRLSLTAPKKSVPLAAYRVKKGDSLTTIAKKHGIQVSTLKKMNNLRRNHVYAGEVLRLRPRA